jgi:hypothetical protein
MRIDDILMIQGLIIVLLSWLRKTYCNYAFVQLDRVELGYYDEHHLHMNL